MHTEKVSSDGFKLIARLNNRVSLRPNRAIRDLSIALAKIARDHAIALRLKAGNFTAGEREIRLSAALHKCLTQRLHPSFPEEHQIARGTDRETIRSILEGAIRGFKVIISVGAPAREVVAASPAPRRIDFEVRDEHAVFGGLTAEVVRSKAEDLRSLAGEIEHLSGFWREESGIKPGLGYFGLELKPVKVYVVRSSRWEGITDSIPFPFRSDLEGGFVPLLGGIYIAGSALSEEKLERLGIKAAEHDGEPVSFPFFFAPGKRSLFFPHQSMLLLLRDFEISLDGKVMRIKMGKRKKLIRSPEVLEQVIEKICREEAPKILEEIRTDTQRILEDLWASSAASRPQINKTQFVSRHFDSKYLLNLSLKLLKIGGFIEIVQGVAQEFKCVGAKYIGRIVTRDEESGDFPLRDGETINEEPTGRKEFGEKAAVACRQELLGKEGIFPDTIYQPQIDTSPIGAGVESEARAIEVDEMLLAHGAYMAGISLGKLKLMDKERISQLLREDAGREYQGEDLYVIYRIITDDTRRLEHIAFEGLYEAYLAEQYGSTDNLQAAKRKHLLELSSNLGMNARILLDLGLTVPKQAMTIKDLNPKGGIIDTGDLVKLENEADGFTLIGKWLENIVQVARLGGVETPEYFNGEGFAEFINKFFQDDHGVSQQFLQFLHQPERQTVLRQALEEKGANEVIWGIARILTLEWLHHHKQKDRTPCI